MKTILATLLFIATPLLAKPSVTDMRKWTDKKGRAIEAKLLKVNKQEIFLKRKNGLKINFKLDLLSEKDVQLLRQWLSQNPTGVAPPSPPFHWPHNFNGGSSSSVEYVKFDKARGAHLYKTKYFDFYIEKKMTNSTVSKCVAVFDCIVGALDSLPMGLDTEPGGNRPRYQAILVATKQKYMEMGGIPNSAGFFAPSKNLTVIPFESMGIVKKGNNFAFDGKGRDFSTLIHEVVHHSTSHWRGMPAWYQEGLADYLSAMPYRSGGFSFSGAGASIAKQLRKYKGTTVENQIMPKGVYRMLSPSKLFKLNRREWNANMSNRLLASRQYNSSMLLAYYYMHCDDRGDGRHFIEWMHAQRALGTKTGDAHNMGLVNKHLIRDRSTADLQKDIIEKLSKNGIKVQF